MSMGILQYGLAGFKAEPKELRGDSLETEQISDNQFAVLKKLNDLQSPEPYTVPSWATTCRLQANCSLQRIANMKVLAEEMTTPSGGLIEQVFRAEFPPIWLKSATAR